VAINQTRASSKHASNSPRAQAENLRLVERALCSDVGPIARRDWINWISSAKKIQIVATLGFAVLYSTLVLYATGYDRGRFLSILTDCPLFSLG